MAYNVLDNIKWEELVDPYYDVIESKCKEDAKIAFKNNLLKMKANEPTYQDYELCTINYSEDPVKLPTNVKCATVISDKKDVQKVPIRKLAPATPIPHMFAWTPINKNLTDPEAGRLLNIPYLGDEVLDEDFSFIDKYVYEYNDGVDYEEGNRYGDNARLFKLIDMMVDHQMMICDKNDIQEYGPSLNNNVGEKMLPENQNGLKPSPCPGIFKAIGKKLIYKFGTEEEIRKKYMDYLKPEEKILDHTFRTYMSQYCRRCCVYGCLLHCSEYDVPFKNVRKRSNNDLTPSLDPCGNECYMYLNGNSNQNTIGVKSTAALDGPSTSASTSNETTSPLNGNNNDEWDHSDQSLFLSLCDVFPKNYCVIAQTMLTKTCKQVYEYWRKEMGHDNAPPLDNSQQSATEENLKLDIKSLKKIQFQWIKQRKEKLSQDLSEVKHVWTPCDHEGPCGLELCTCYDDGHFCDKLCNCSNDCPYRFPGCRCKGPCDNTGCRCYSVNRECDPDLCTGCGANKIEAENIACKNVCMQRGIHKHLLMAPSNIAGWGIFTKEKIKKHELISEYCGTVITQEEATSRSILYNKIKNSYLFNLNEEYVVDGRFSGNKIRFANHSNKPNAMARVIMVNGDHRIGIYATRNIDICEEIFFDYGASFWDLTEEEKITKNTKKTSNSEDENKKINDNHKCKKSNQLKNRKVNKKPTKAKNTKKPSSAEK